MELSEKITYNFNKLWHLLLDKEMSKKQLAEKAGVSVASLGRMKRGQALSYDRMMRICKVVDCDITEIMDVKKEE